MTRITILILFNLLAFKFAKAQVEPRHQHEVLHDLLQEVRDPVFSSEERKEILSDARKKMAEMLASEVKAPEEKLKRHFREHPTETNILLSGPWPDLQTQFYTTLHQETFTERWKNLAPLVKFTSYGEGLYTNIVGHLGNFSPVKEGRYYLRWHENKEKKR